MEPTQSKLYAIDIDGVICHTEGMEYANSTPIQSRIDGVNRLFEAGHTVYVYTGRHWNHYFLTQQQLKEWGVKHHYLVMGCLPADVYINDRMMDVSVLEEV